MVSESAYRVDDVDIAPRLVAGVRAEVPMGRVGQEFRRHLDQVYAAARTGALALDGQNIFIYRAMTGGVLTVDFCVGATAAFTAIGVVEPRMTPDGRAAHTVHVGDYAGLRHAHAAIDAWCVAHGRTRAGPSWEVYGHWHDDPSQLRTDVYHLLR